MLLLIITESLQLRSTCVPIFARFFLQADQQEYQSVILLFSVNSLRLVQSKQIHYAKMGFLAPVF